VILFVHTRGFRCKSLISGVLADFDLYPWIFFLGYFFWDFSNSSTGFSLVSQIFHREVFVFPLVSFGFYRPCSLIFVSFWCKRLFHSLYIRLACRPLANPTTATPPTQRTAPQRTAPHRTAPHRTASCPAAIHRHCTPSIPATQSASPPNPYKSTITPVLCCFLCSVTLCARFSICYQVKADREQRCHPRPSHHLPRRNSLVHCRSFTATARASFSAASATRNTVTRSTSPPAHTHHCCVFFIHLCALLRVLSLCQISSRR
jgi:hypothetical protein